MNERDESVQQVAPGHLVLRRTTAPGFNSIVLMLADAVDRRAPVGEVLGEGVIVEVISVEETREGLPKVHVGIRAPASIRIERQEHFTAPQEVRTPQSTLLGHIDRARIDAMTDSELDEFMGRGRDELIAREDALRRLKEEISKAELRGYHHKNNDGHLNYRLLKNESLAQQSQRDAMTGLLGDLRTILAGRRRAQSERRAADFYQSFFQTARSTLDAGTFEALSSAARTAVGQPSTPSALD